MGIHARVAMLSYKMYIIGKYFLVQRLCIIDENHQLYFVQNIYGQFDFTAAHAIYAPKAKYLRRFGFPNFLHFVVPSSTNEKL